MALKHLTQASDPEIMTVLGARLAALRKAQGLTMIEVADQTGLSRRTVGRAEQGDNPTLATILQLLRAYGSLAALENFIPEPELSPMAVLKEARGKNRG